MTAWKWVAESGFIALITHSYRYRSLVKPSERTSNKLINENLCFLFYIWWRLLTKRKITFTNKGKYTRKCVHIGNSDTLFPGQTHTYTWMHLDLRFAMKKFGRSEGPALPNLLVTGLGWGVNGGADNSGLSRRESQAIVLSFFLPLWLGWAVMLSLRSPVYVGGRASTKGESESEIARFFSFHASSSIFQFFCWSCRHWGM